MKKYSNDLFRAALYRLLLVLQKDALFHLKLTLLYSDIAYVKNFPSLLNDLKRIVRSSVNFQLYCCILIWLFSNRDGWMH
jgi:hypothetical protein